MLDGTSLPGSTPDRSASLDPLDGDGAARLSLHSTFRVRLRVSVILPFFNEAANAGRTASAVIDFAGANPEFHFVFVDDGSTDGTASVLETRIVESGRGSIELLRLERNGGKGRALRRALARCRGDLVCFTDGDLPYALDHLFLLDRQLAENHVVIGSRVLGQGRGGGRARRFYGSGFNFLVRSILGLKFGDTQAGLKGLRREVAEHLFSLQRIDGFAFDAELLYLARKFGYRVAEIPARVSESHAYNASPRRLVVDASRMLREVAAIRRNDLLGRYQIVSKPLERVA